MLFGIPSIEIIYSELTLDISWSLASSLDGRLLASSLDGRLLASSLDGRLLASSLAGCWSFNIVGISLSSLDSCLESSLIDSLLSSSSILLQSKKEIVPNNFWHLITYVIFLECGWAVKYAWLFRFFKPHFSLWVAPV